MKEKYKRELFVYGIVREIMTGPLEVVKGPGWREVTRAGGEWGLSCLTPQGGRCPNVR